MQSLLCMYTSHEKLMYRLWLWMKCCEIAAHSDGHSVMCETPQTRGNRKCQRGSIWRMCKRNKNDYQERTEEKCSEPWGCRQENELRDLGNSLPITLDVWVLFQNINNLNDEVLLMRGCLKWQQTTSEAFTKACSLTISRVHKLEGEMLGVKSRGCSDFNQKAITNCQKLQAQEKPMVSPNVTAALSLIEPAVTRISESAVIPVPVEIDSETDSQCRWSNVAKKTRKRVSNLRAEQFSYVVSVKRQGKSVIGSAKVKTITTAVKR